MKENTNGITIFSNPQFGQIRVTTTESNEPMFCLADVCKALELTNPAMVKSRLSAKGISNTDTLTAGGVQSMTYINEANLYKCIFQSRKTEAEKFQDWVYEEVLPSIRKHGAYITPLTIDSIIADPASGIKLLQALQQERKEKELAQAEVKEQQELIIAKDDEIRDLNEANAEMRVKVSYLDQILASKSTVTTTQIAQDYGMSAKKFNIELRNLHIQRKVGGQWILYSPYNTMGYVHSETFIPDCSTTGKVIMVSRWTQKGRLFLYEILKKNGILPLIEQSEKKGGAA